MLAILIASIWTIIILVIGGVFGFLIGSKELDKSVARIPQSFKKPPDSGPIKPKSPQDLVYEKNKTVIDRQKELMQ